MNDYEAGHTAFGADGVGVASCLHSVNRLILTKPTQAHHWEGEKK